MIATKAALIALLEGDSTINNALARDPKDAGRPAIFEATRNQAPPVYDSLTFRLPEFRPDGRFRPTAAEGGGRSPIAEQSLQIEVWSAKSSSRDVEQIADRLETLLDGQALQLPDGAGLAFRCELQMRSAPLPDTTDRTWFILMQFRLRLHRNL